VVAQLVDDAPAAAGDPARMSSRLRWCLVWSVAFGVAEAAVVVYLRRLCYPEQPLDGPLFPLRVVEPLVLTTELLREAATLLMLLGVAFLAERRPVRRFAVYALCFGVWDLVYYAVLLLLLGWPASLLEWDVLFLLPVPWAAPVLAPVLVSLALVACALVLLRRVGELAPSPMRRRDWWIEAGCGALILTSFVWNTDAILGQEPPRTYPWWLFLAGWLGGLGWFAHRMRSARPA
jgi:hypothetical protein